MGQFYDYGRDFTEAELDRAALESCGRVASIGYGYCCRAEMAPQHGYGFSWIGTGGMGNCGTLVLKGLTPAKRALLREGRVRWVMRVAECSRALAEEYCSTPHAGYEWEVEVIQNAMASWGDPRWLQYDASKRGGVLGQLAELDLPVVQPMTGPRWEAVRQLSGSIAAKVAAQYTQKTRA